MKRKTKQNKRTNAAATATDKERTKAENGGMR